MAKNAIPDRGETKIKLKLVLGFTILVIALSASGYLIYRSFEKLLQATETLSKPSREVKFFEDMLIDISQLEMSARSYIVTDKDSFLQQLNDISLGISRKVDQKTRELSFLQAYQTQTDSIKSLVAEIPKNIRVIKNLKTKQEELASGEKIDSIIREEMTHFEPGERNALSKDISPQLTVKEVEVLKKFVNELETLKNKKLPRKIKSKKQSEIEDTQEDIAILEESVKAQLQKMLGSMLTDRPMHSLRNIDQAFDKQTQEEDQLWANINSKEFFLIQQNFSIIKALKKILTRLEKEANQYVDENKASARKVVRLTGYQVIYITIPSVFCAAMLLYFISLDLTKSKFYKTQLLEAKKEAEEHALAKARFTANMSHEIRTPLHAIIGYTEQLKKHVSIHRELEEPVKSISFASEHLLGLVNDILDFSKIESQNNPLKEENFSLQSILEHVIQSLQTRAKDKGLALNYHIQPEANLYYLGDSLKISQILYNLTGNAVKFTEEGSVFVSAKADKISSGEYLLCLEVADTGIGISEEGQKRLFENFYQVDDSISKKYGGSGLGLAISYQLVKILRGDIQLQSELGKGTVFRVTIPLKISQNQNTIQNTTPKSIPDKIQALPFPYKILAVDDDTLNLKLYEALIQEMGLQIETATTGQLALQMLEKKTYDLMLLDNQMPEMSGSEVLQHLRNDQNIPREKLPVIMITANIVQDDLNRLLRLGANDYLIKPYKAIDLYHKIIAVLNSQSFNPSNPKKHVQS